MRGHQGEAQLLQRAPGMASDYRVAPCNYLSMASFRGVGLVGGKGIRDRNWSPSCASVGRSGVTNWSKENCFATSLSDIFHPLGGWNESNAEIWTIVAACLGGSALHHRMPHVSESGCRG